MKIQEKESMSDNTRDRLETLASGFMDARILLTAVELEFWQVEKM